MSSEVNLGKQLVECYPEDSSSQALSPLSELHSSDSVSELTDGQTMPLAQSRNSWEQILIGQGREEEDSI